MENLSAKEAFYLLRLFRHVKNPVQKFFFQQSSIENKFQEILHDLNANKHPTIVVDKLSTAIHQKFVELHKQMTKEDYYFFCSEVTKSILEHLESNIGVWMGRVVNFKSVKEIWVACEPMLDLVNEQGGTFELLQKQLKYVDKINYFLSNPSYYNDLKNLLSQECGSKFLDKINFVHLDKPYNVPIVIFHSTTKHGLIGKNHPVLQKKNDGFYSFKRQLENDWVSDIDSNLITHYYNDLTKQINNT